MNTLRETGRTTRRRPSKGAVTAVAIGTASALVAGAAAYALWSATAGFTGGDITAGDLQLTVGEATWEQVTPGVTDTASGTLDATPDFDSMPGDVIRIRVPVTTYLEGDNLVGALVADYVDAGAVSEDISATFHIEDDKGAQVAPASGSAALGEPLSPPELVGDDAGVTDTWTVVIDVEVLGEYAWQTPDTADDPHEWTIGGLDLQLLQVRDGPGYTTDGA